MDDGASIRSAAFIGWYRATRRQPWRPVVQADSEDAAIDNLLREPTGDKIVLPTGRNVNHKLVRFHFQV